MKRQFERRDGFLVPLLADAQLREDRIGLAGLNRAQRLDVAERGIGSRVRVEIGQHRELGGIARRRGARPVETRRREIAAVVVVYQCKPAALLVRLRLRLDPHEAEDLRARSFGRVKADA